MHKTIQIKNFITSELMPYLGNSINFDNFNLLANGLDSLKIMLLINFIEKTFNVTIDNEDSLPENFATLSDIIKLLESKKENSLYDNTLTQ
jgi:acyl carrier protein